MRLYLIRHAESEHNVARAYSGTTDSSLTNHGVFQISRLAASLRERGVRFALIFSSPLQRARLTAEGVADATGYRAGVVLHDELVEKHFGLLEGLSFQEVMVLRQAAGMMMDLGLDEQASPQESAGSMTARANTFIRDSLLPECERLEEGAADGKEGEEVVSIAVVSHGVMLGVLWESLVQQCSPRDGVRFGSEEMVGQQIRWANTAYLEIELARDVPHQDTPAASTNNTPATTAANDTAPSSLSHDTETPSWQVTVLAVNQQIHLHGVRRTAGGIGSAIHDKTQRRLDDFVQQN